MKRKQQESMIKLAFSEYKNETEKKVIEASTLNADSQKELELISSMRDGLKQAGRSTPECQMSVERVRDAILNQNIQQPRSSATFWSWASVAVAACAFVFVLNTNRNQVSEPRFVANTSKPSIIQQNNPLADQPTDDEVASLFPLVSETQTQPQEPAPRIHARPTVSTVKGPSSQLSADITTTMAVRSIEHALGDRSNSMRESRSVPVAEDAKTFHGMGGPVATPETASEPIILIDTNTDSDTGAQVATEVGSFENVHIGG